MPSHIVDFELFGDQCSTPEMRAVFDERAMIQRWLDVGAALAAAQGELGLIPAHAADTIAQRARIERPDLAAALDPRAYTGLAGSFVDRVVDRAGAVTAARA